MIHPVITIEGLTLALPSFGDRTYAVENVSLAIAPGETLCIVGESGSGKSMIAHAIMGLLPEMVKPIAGSINLSGRDLLALDEAQMRGVRGRVVGLIFQEPMTSLNPVMRVVDQIAETFEAHGLYDGNERRKRAIELIAEVGLPDPKSISRAFPHELSGGQRQRVMIAMALALEPKLLIADEPTTALDVTTQAQILSLIDELRRKRGMAVMFITHDFGVVAEIADRVAVLRNGKLVEEGSADTVLSRPSHDYTKSLLAAVPSLTPPSRPILLTRIPVLKVENLNKVYRKHSFFQPAREVAAARAISFTLCRGETLGLVGESGSGKSTVGRCCLRLIEPDNGKITLGDLVLTDLPATALRQHRRRIQTVFQDPFASLNPRHTVGRILSDGPVANGVSRDRALQRAKELLEFVGLPAKAVERYPHEFSGGQRQRIGIARALGLEPEVLVADEAVSALDVSVQAQVLSLIKDIQRRLSLAILFVTHDLRVAAQVCDRIAVMHRGEIVEEGDTESVFTTPRHEYTRRLLAAVPGALHFREVVLPDGTPAGERPGISAPPF